MDLVGQRYRDFVSTAIRQTRKRAAMPRQTTAYVASALMQACAAMLAALAPLAPWALRASTPIGPQPNIVVILADDLGFSDLGCYGGEIRTPNLDRLAAQGLRFTQFYNCALCVTSRAAFYTGLYPRHGGSHVQNDGAYLLHDNMVTLGEVLQQAGYQTSLTGKWHLGSQPRRCPIKRGFDEYYGLLDGACNYFNPAWRDPSFYGGSVRSFVHNDKRITEFPDDYYTTDAFTEHAVKQIHGFAKTGKPFLLIVCYNAPHFPLHAKRKDIDRYRGKYSMGYFKLREQRYRRQIDLGIIDPSWKLSPVDRKLGPWLRDRHIEPWEAVDDRHRQEALMEVYAAMVDSMDQGIGRIMEALEAAAVADNTLVMFLSDNGGSAAVHRGKETDPSNNYYGGTDMPGRRNSYTSCEAGWGWAQNAPFRRYKFWIHEGGIATPLIARWPSVIAPGTITRQVGHVLDFMPTMIELAGAEYPHTYRGEPIPSPEGKSLAPILHGRQREPHDTLCWFLEGNRAIRREKWKLVWGRTTGRWELYDMEADRTETNDLADNYPDRVKQMADAWHEWAKQTGVPSASCRIPYRASRE